MATDRGGAAAKERGGGGGGEELKGYLSPERESTFGAGGSSLGRSHLIEGEREESPGIESKLN